MCTKVQMPPLLLIILQIGTSTATRSCRDPGTEVIYFWLPACVRRRPHRVTFTGSGGRRDTLRPPALLLQPGSATTAAAAGAAV